MDSAAIGALIGFGSLFGFFLCTALYEKCQQRQQETLPVFTSNPQQEPLLLHRQKSSMKEFLQQSGILPLSIK